MLLYFCVNEGDQSTPRVCEARLRANFGVDIVTDWESSSINIDPDANWYLTATVSSTVVKHKRAAEPWRPRSYHPYTLPHHRLFDPEVVTESTSETIPESSDTVDATSSPSSIWSSNPSVIRSARLFGPVAT